MDLLHNNEEYASMRKQILAFQAAHPFIPDVMEEKKGVYLFMYNNTQIKKIGRYACMTSVTSNNFLTNRDWAIEYYDEV